MELNVHKLLFLLPEEVAHTVALKALKLLRFLPARKKKSENFKLWGLTFKNRVGLAAGFDKNGQCIDEWFRLGFGFIELGTVTPRPQLGNPRPRLFRLTRDQAVINRMGFNNEGVNALVARLKKRNTQLGVVGVNIGKNKDTPNEIAYQDYLYCLEQVYQYADYVVVNLSSPNTPGLRALQTEEFLNTLLAKLKDKQLELKQKYQKYTPLLIKISPDEAFDTLETMLGQFIQFEIDGLIISNTTISRPKLLEQTLSKEAGGLSGKPLRMLSDRTLEFCVKKIEGKFPIIGSGGVMNAYDAARKIRLGAAMVQIYTGLIYKGPRIVKDAVKRIN